MKLEEPLDYFERVAWPMHVKSHRDALNDSSISMWVVIYKICLEVFVFSSIVVIS